MALDEQNECNGTIHCRTLQATRWPAEDSTVIWPECSLVLEARVVNWGRKIGIRENLMRLVDHELFSS